MAGGWSWNEYGNALARMEARADEALGDSQREEFLRGHARRTLSIGFFLVGYVPTTESDALAQAWWQDAHRRLDELVETAWREKQRRKYILRTGILSSDFFQEAWDSRLDPLYLGTLQVFGVLNSWPELNPISQTVPIPPLRQAAPSGPSVSPSYVHSAQSRMDPQRAAIMNFTQQMYDQLNAGQWGVIQQAGIANQTLLDDQLRWNRDRGF